MHSVQFTHSSQRVPIPSRVFFIPIYLFVFNDNIFIHKYIIFYVFEPYANGMLYKSCLSLFH